MTALTRRSSIKARGDSEAMCGNSARFAPMTLQPRFPNGVAMDLGGVDARNIGEVIEALGGCGVPPE
jgi:hypothetical protein